jgi:nucleoid DNA-binding protein
METYDKEDRIGNKLFIRLIAAESGFTIADTKIFWEAFERVFQNIILSKKILNIAGFGKFYVTVSKSRKPWDNFSKKYLKAERYYTVSFKLSSTLKKILREKLSEEEEE